MNKERRVLVFGNDGQVSRALAAIWPEAVCVPRDECDFEAGDDAIRTTLDRHRPGLVINPAAYTAVDKAESERDRAARVNAQAPGAIAEWCARHGASLIHYSTDYVYNGVGEAPHSETDATGPLNFYGATKLAGERAVVASGCHHVILRTSWVYFEIGANFVLTMLCLGRERESLRVVDDQIGAPTYASDLAAATATIAGHPTFVAGRSGIYNLANSGLTSWHGFATAVFEEWRTLGGRDLKVREIEPIPSEAYPTPARRPLNSRLDMARIRADYGIEMRHWRSALLACLSKLKTG